MDATNYLTPPTVSVVMPFLYVFISLILVGGSRRIVRSIENRIS